jgi:cobalt-precorrin 5A hydrolase
MSDTVVISLPAFKAAAKKISDMLVVDYMEYDNEAFDTAFREYKNIIAVMSIGIVVRKISSLLKDKWQDPAVIVVSPDLKFAIPVIGGHHGANKLAKKLFQHGICPVLTTATESTGRDSVESIAESEDKEILNRDSTRVVNASILASNIPLYLINGPGIAIVGPGVSVILKKGEYIIGVGCNKGTSNKEIKNAITDALEFTGINIREVMAFATTIKKSKEKDLIDVINSFNANLVFLDDDTINAQYTKNSSSAFLIGLNGVAEPCALALSKRKELIMEKRVYGNVTVAIAR